MHGAGYWATSEGWRKKDVRLLPCVDDCHGRCQSGRGERSRSGGNILGRMTEDVRIVNSRMGNGGSGGERRLKVSELGMWRLKPEAGPPEASASIKPKLKFL